MSFVIYNVTLLVMNSPNFCLSETVFSYLYSWTICTPSTEICLQRNRMFISAQKWTCLFSCQALMWLGESIWSAAEPHLGLLFLELLWVTTGFKSPQQSSTPALDVVETWSARGHQHSCSTPSCQGLWTLPVSGVNCFCSLLGAKLVMGQESLDSPAPASD